MEDAALAALDLAALARDAADLVRIQSVTGDERGAAELVAARADAAGLEAGLHVGDLAALRAHPDHPGEEAARSELWGATATLPGTRAGADRAQRPHRRRRAGERALGARSVLRRGRRRPPVRPRVGRHEGRRDRRAARARRDPARGRGDARGRADGGAVGGGRRPRHVRRARARRRLRRRAAARADRPERRLRAGGRADLPRRDPRPLRPRRRAARRLLSAIDRYVRVHLAFAEHEARGERERRPSR